MGEVKKPIPATCASPASTTARARGRRRRRVDRRRRRSVRCRSPLPEPARACAGGGPDGAASRARWAADAPPPPAPSVLLVPGPKPLGKLEQESVDDARETLGLRIDPSPEGKTIGKIYVVNQEVFSRRDWWFQFFNIFHRTTRGNILERELLFKAGQPVRPGAGRGEHAQPAGAAGSLTSSTGRTCRRPSCRAWS